MMHDRVEIINLCIAIVCAVLAGWLSVTARVRIALAGASHARAAMLTANAKLKEANRDIVSLRRQLAQVIAENEQLHGRLFLSDRPEGSEWEESQTLLDSAAQKIDATIASAPAPQTADHKPIQIENGKLIFRKGPIELDPSDFAGDNSSTTSAE